MDEITDVNDVLALQDRYERLMAAVREHWSQKADDRCREDDDRLYEAAGLPPVDRRVGDKAEMLANCAKFIERRCEGGHWPTYQSLMSALMKTGVAAVALTEVPPKHYFVRLPDEDLADILFCHYCGVHEKSMTDSDEDCDALASARKALGWRAPK